MVETATVRKWVLDSNDGIISTTGIIQGFAGAGASDETVLFAAVTLMITGGLSLGGSAYAEAAQDRAAELAIIEEQQRRLAMSPDEERAELREHYVKRGLDPRLADQVASQLMTRDPLGAQLETEFGILDGASPATQPFWIAVRGFFAFLCGALPLTIAVVFVDDAWRLTASLLVVVLFPHDHGARVSESGDRPPAEGRHPVDRSRPVHRTAFVPCRQRLRSG